MKVLFLILVLLSSTTVLAASWQQQTVAVLKEYDYACKNSEVVIDSVVRNESIKGHVVGMPTDFYKKFKVVFYVKTNRWYVHPYASQGQDGDGYSHTYPNADGTFEIKTVLRDVPASKLAAVLVPRPYKIQNQHFRLHPLWGRFGGVTKYSCTYTTRKGNGDFFL